MREDISSGYLFEVLDPIKAARIINKIVTQVRNLKKKVKKIDAIVVTGVSGLLVGPTVSLRTKIPIIVVRKKETTHSYLEVEGVQNIKNYIIIDDIVETGKTVETIYKKILEHSKNYNKPNLVGIITYLDKYQKIVYLNSGMIKTITLKNKINISNVTITTQ